MTIQDALDALTAGGIGFEVLSDEGDEFPLTLGKAAELYALRGWPVFPLQIGSKVPWPGSKGFKQASTDLNVVRRWWAKQPRCNIGLATGHLFDVVDVDLHHGADQFWPALKPYIESSGEVATPSGGLHIYIRPTGAPNTANFNGMTGIDYRGLGGYVVAPPSVLNRGLYEWTVTAGEDLRTGNGIT